MRSAVWFATGALLATALTLLSVHSWRVDAAQEDAESTFVPITPCRLVDTRQPGEAPLNDGEIRAIEAHGTNGVAGSSCTIPSEAVALSMNVTALDASAPTYWTIWPDGEPQPETSSLNPAPGQPPTPNAVTTPISPAGTFNVFNDAGTVEMLVDITGYYTTSSLAEMAARIADLERYRPRANADSDLDLQVITSEPRKMGELPPLFSSATDPYFETTMIVNYSISVEQDEPGVVVECQLNGYGWSDLAPTQRWQSTGDPGSVGHLSGTRTLGYWSDVPDGVTLLCRHSGDGDPTIASDATMNALHLPDPATASYQPTARDTGST